MSKRIVKSAITLILVTGIFIFSYMSFATYRPKILRKVQEVKGLSNINTDDTPYPADAVKIGFNQTPKSKQTTFKTGKTQEEVWDFYKNIFSGKKWKLISEKSFDNTLTFSFKKEKEVVTVVVTQQEDTEYTIVSVENLRE